MFSFAGPALGRYAGYALPARVGIPMSSFGGLRIAIVKALGG
jgi:hypothetical protein